MKRRRTPWLVLMAAVLVASAAMAQDQRTNVMVFQGRLTDVRANGRNGLKIIFTNMYNGVYGSCVTPFNPKIPGSYFLYLADLNNNAAAMTDDQMVIDVIYPNGSSLPSGLPMPYTFVLGKGDAHACIKTMNVISY